MSNKGKIQRQIGGETFVIWEQFPRKRDAESFAAKIRKGGRMLVRILKHKHDYCVYVRDGRR